MRSNPITQSAPRVAMLLLALLAMNIAANAKTPIVRPMTFYGVSPSKLASLYKSAYLETGFKFTLKKRGYKRDRRSNRLIFEFPNPRHPRNYRGYVAIEIIAGDHGKCTPCEVYKEVFPAGYFGEYSSQEWAALQSEILAADGHAAAKVQPAIQNGTR